ncbi:hypothetical protein [Micromonospora profundi]|uniref:hypothetical protein n=1 Tax=Micromonospora profundi TaxID=1420889 RepID=UPI00365D3291
MTAADHPHTDPGDGRTECERCGKFVWPAIHSCKGVPVTAAARARMGLPAARTTSAHDTAEQIRRDERERIRAALSLPMLQALRLIPHGRVQQGCVISDGDVVRERLRAAYFGITADQPPPSPPLDLAEVAPWMELCGHCDAGLPQSCTCPPGDPRVMIAALVDEIVRQRQEANR